ncbi:MAG: RsmB/NOP family class I SAM-dependent RNA methyltransferase [Myxococcota bacterium]
MQVAREALRRSRREDGDAGHAARLVLNSRALHSRQRRAAGDILFALARLGARLDARIRHAQERGAVPGRLDQDERDAWRLAAYLVAESGRSVDDVGRALSLDRSALTALADPHYLDALSGAERLTVEQAMPRWLVERLVSERGEAEARAALEALNQRAPLTLRSSVPREALLEELRKLGVPAEPTRYSPVGVHLLRHINVKALEPYRAGRCEVQDEGSQLIALAVHPRPGELLVDACAGAGGKALALCALEPRAEVVAIEPEGGRLAGLRERARRAGVRIKGIHAGVGDPATAPLLGRADAVLVDAPCSGTGTLRREPENRWRYGPEDVARFAETQWRIAVDAVGMLKPGGRLIYATCSLLSEENETIVRKLGELPTLQPVPLVELLPEGVARDAGAEGNMLRLWPHRHGTDGFFMAAFRRRES